MTTWKQLMPLVLIVFLPVIGSCLLNADKVPPCNDCGGSEPVYLPLTERDNVLHNLELAYNQRNFEEYRRLLDSTPNVFLFFFSVTDVNQGKVKNSSWDLGKELASAEAMFDRNPPSGPVADDVDLELDYIEGEDQWQPVVPSTHPAETWYDKQANYTLRVRVGGVTYTQNKVVKALFTVRFTEVEGDSIWQIVTWRDDIP